MSIILPVPAPEGFTSSSPSILGKILSQYSLDQALTFIGQMSFQIQNQDPPVIRIDGVPVLMGALAYISRKLIEHTDNSPGKRKLDENGLREAVQHLAVMYDPRTSQDELDESRLRQYFAQFYYNEDVNYHLARTYALFDHYWHRNATTSKVGIHSLFEETTGFSMKEAMLFGSALSESCIRGTVGYAVPNEAFRNRLLAVGIDPLKQPKFFDWFSLRYDQFREITATSGQNDNYLDKYKANPLLSKPLLNPNSDGSGRYIVPVPVLLAFGVTTGIFHLLGDQSINPNSKLFRGHFGRVFEDYIVDLLHQLPMPSESIIREQKYGKKGSEKPTSDAMLVHGDTAVLIEIKHSCLDLTSKISGSLADVRKAINGNIVDGIIQLHRFHNDLTNAKQLKGLSDLSHIREIEHLIVIHETIPFLNDIIRRQARLQIKERNIQNRENPELIVPDDFHFHIISANELERLVEAPQIDLFAFLRKKRVSSENDVADFDAYSEDEYGRLPHSKFLEKFFLEFKNSLK